MLSCLLFEAILRDCLVEHSLDKVQLGKASIPSGAWQYACHRCLNTVVLIAGLLFFELMFLTFRSMFTALFTFPDEYKMLLK